MGGGEVTKDKKMIAGTNIAVNFLQMGRSLIQAKPEKAPETWAAGGYEKKGQKSGGVIALMDMLSKDLDTQISEGKKDEEYAQKSYEQLMSDAAATRATDTKSIADKESARADANSRLSGANVAIKQRGAELKDTNKYIANLHGDCDWLLENYGFRKDARSKEAEALKQA